MICTKWKKILWYGLNIILYFVLSQSYYFINCMQIKIRLIFTHIFVNCLTDDRPPTINQLFAHCSSMIFVSRNIVSQQRSPWRSKYSFGTTWYYSVRTYMHILVRCHQSFRASGWIIDSQIVIICQYYH